ncbi:MAG: tetratricopeptide repeat protein [Armatimonadota bacterium]
MRTTANMFFLKNPLFAAVLAVMLAFAGTSVRGAERFRLLQMPGTNQYVLFWSAGSSQLVQNIAEAVRKSNPKVLVLFADPSSPEVAAASAEGQLKSQPGPSPTPQELVALGTVFGAEVVIAPGKDRKPLVGGFVVASSVNGGVEFVPADDQAPEAVASVVSKQLKAVASTPDALYRRGLILLSKHCTIDALDSLSSAVALSPNTVEYRLAYAKALRAVNRNREAANEIRRALRQQPSNSAALMALAEMEAERGRWTSALKAAEQAASVPNAPSEAHRLLGDICLAAGRTLQAVEEYTLAGKNPKALLPLAKLLIKQGRFDEAALAAMDALAILPNDTAARGILADAYSSGGRYADAVSHRSQVVMRVVEAANERQPAVSCGSAYVHRGPPALSADDEAELTKTVRALLNDILSGVRGVQAGTVSRTSMYKALQESLLASDRLRAVLMENSASPVLDEVEADRMLAYSLWSQSSYDLIKALESDDRKALRDALELVEHAVRKLDDANRVLKQRRPA